MSINQICRTVVLYGLGQLLLSGAPAFAETAKRIELPFYPRQKCPTWLFHTPKVVLHHHLDGSVRPETTLDIAQKENLDLGVPLNLDSVREATTVRVPQNNLIKVLQRFWVFQKVFTSYENVKRVTVENLEDLHRDGVKLVELRFAPAFMANGKSISAEEIIHGVADGLIEGKERFPDMEVGLIHIVVRSHAGANVEEMKSMNERSSAAAIAFRNSDHPMANRMVGFDLAGAEADTPPSDYVPLVKLALEGGLQITVHSGEEPKTNADYVRQSIELLHASRIGHGIQAWADPRVVQMLRNQNIHLELSPSSNWITRSIPGMDFLEGENAPSQLDLKRHPIADFWRAGISVSIEGDDPQLFGISVVHEYQLLHYLMGLKKTDFMEINRRAALHSFLPEEIKRAVIEKYFHQF